MTLPGSGREGQFPTCAEAVTRASPMNCPAIANLKNLRILKLPETAFVARTRTATRGLV